jgi:uncharacterized membrane protein
MAWGMRYVLRIYFLDSYNCISLSNIQRLIDQNKTQSIGGKSALDIAKERYSKGEITKEELE